MAPERLLANDQFNLIRNIGTISSSLQLRIFEIRHDPKKLKSIPGIFSAKLDFNARKPDKPGEPVEQDDQVNLIDISLTPDDDKRKFGIKIYPQLSRLTFTIFEDESTKSDAPIVIEDVGTEPNPPTVLSDGRALASPDFQKVYKLITGRNLTTDLRIKKVKEIDVGDHKSVF